MKWLIFMFLSVVLGHAVLTQVEYKGQTSCAVHTGGCRSTNNLKMRELIPRSGNEGVCANPPGCEANFTCDHCGLEKVVLGNSIDTRKWWARMPAVNWDQKISQPWFPCMSRDSFGARGTMHVDQGGYLRTRIYINADHSGLYRYELTCGTQASNAAFSAGPITPWRALHQNKDGVQLPPSRDVGWTRAETDTFFHGTTCTGAGCPYRMNRNIHSATSSHCTNNPWDCFVEDYVLIPHTCDNTAILRWFWLSAEGNEIYANCLDLQFDGSGADGPEHTPEDSEPDGVCFPGESCLATPGCCPTGFQCYEKDRHWASCRQSCIPGSINPYDPPEYQTPWTCRVI